MHGLEIPNLDLFGATWLNCDQSSKGLRLSLKMFEALLHDQSMGIHLEPIIRWFNIISRFNGLQIIGSWEFTKSARNESNTSTSSPNSALLWDHWLLQRLSYAHPAAENNPTPHAPVALLRLRHCTRSWKSNGIWFCGIINRNILFICLCNV